MRSSLYPIDWKPGMADARGRFLHDWSHAGYRKSEVPLPTINGPITDVTAAPYRADATGKSDATDAIQAALDAVGTAGGGVVFMPAGTYLIRLKPGKDFAIQLKQSRVILRGAGRDQTRLYCDDVVTRQKMIVLMRPADPPTWFSGLYPTPLTQDLPIPTVTLPVKSVDPFSPGELIAVRTSLTDAFIAGVGMAGKWKANDPTVRGMTLARRITKIDRQAGTLTIDTPTRYPMLMRDELRVYALCDTVIQESAFEDFSIGMRPLREEGWAEGDFSKEATGAHKVHFSCAISLTHAENCWARGLGTFAADPDRPMVHVHSNGLRLAYCRQVTVTDCDFRHAQYHGGGGNGYLFMVNGSDNLFTRNTAVDGRHNFDLQTMACTGNVLHRNVSRDGSLPCDFHMYLSTANLVDAMDMDGDFFECRYRPYATPEHGAAGAQNVFWNTSGRRYGRAKYIIHSAQTSGGCVIGTRGPASEVRLGETDFAEAIGQGDQLEPASLWEDQLRRRLHPS